MTNYSPSALFLKNLQERLSVLNMPVFFRLPDSSVLEPFLVIGTNSSDTSRTAQTGRIIEDMRVAIDIFVDGSSRTVAEEIKAKAIRAIGLNQRITADVIMDDSIGREVFHIVLSITDIIL